MISVSWRLASLLPNGVAAFEWRAPFSETQVDPLDEVHLHRMAAKRRAEFLAGRACARAALATFDVQGTSLEPKATRAPSWPLGFVGSITHTDEYCAAAVAPRTCCTGLGIDAEQISRVSPALWNDILSPRERELIDGLEPAMRQVHVALAFSAKEAFFKAQHPLTGIWLDFADVAVALDQDRFTIDCPKTAHLAAGTGGRFLVADDLVLTAVCL